MTKDTSQGERYFIVDQDHLAYYGDESGYEKKEDLEAAVDIQDYDGGNRLVIIKGRVLPWRLAIMEA